MQQLLVNTCNCTLALNFAKYAMSVGLFVRLNHVVVIIDIVTQLTRLVSFVKRVLHMVRGVSTNQ